MAQVEIVIGSKSDHPAIKDSKILDLLTSVGITWRLSILSAHRHDAELTKFVQKQILADTCCVIAAAGRAAALAGSIVAKLKTPIPVIGVALSSSDQPTALDAALSMTRTPAGTAIAFTGMNKAGFINAAILACQIISLTSTAIQDNVVARLETIKKSKPPQIGIETSPVNEA